MLNNKNMRFLGNYREEFIAKLIGDYTKIILAAFFAGEFFLKLSSLQRILFWIVFVILVIICILLHPREKR
ncbi:hypothetical protein KJ693_00935 [bacterium]|nr:hypothetical protein [bacterium]MBU1613855.1 hypothetical protein [bacterium]